MITPRLVSRNDAATYLDVSLRTLISRVDPELDRVSIGRRVLYDVRDLDAWIDQRKDQARVVRRTSVRGLRGV
jgi:hypothetical protein